MRRATRARAEVAWVACPEVGTGEHRAWMRVAALAWRCGRALDARARVACPKVGTGVRRGRGVGAAARARARADGAMQAVAAAFVPPRWAQALPQDFYFSII